MSERFRSVDGGFLSLPDEGDLPLFRDQPTRANLGRIQPRLHHDVDTSQAEETRLRGVIRGQARAILDYLVAWGPHTRRELARALSIEICSVCPAVDGLRREGFVVQLEERRAGGHLLAATPYRGARGRAA